MNLAPQSERLQKGYGSLSEVLEKNKTEQSDANLRMHLAATDRSILEFDNDLVVFLFADVHGALDPALIDV